MVLCLLSPQPPRMVDPGNTIANTDPNEWLFRWEPAPPVGYSSSLGACEEADWGTTKSWGFSRVMLDLRSKVRSLHLCAVGDCRKLILVRLLPSGQLDLLFGTHQPISDRRRRLAQPRTTTTQWYPLFYSMRPSTSFWRSSFKRRTCSAPVQTRRRRRRLPSPTTNGPLHFKSVLCSLPIRPNY
jgi:hypothetical protein